MPCSCFWWGMQRFEQVRRKPQLFVFERSEEFCAAGASPYRPVPRIAPDTQKTAQQGCLLLWWGIQRIERARAQALGCACSERSGELCRACGKPLPSPAPHYFRYIKTAQNGCLLPWWEMRKRRAGEGASPRLFVFGAQRRTLPRMRQALTVPCPALLPIH